MHLTHSLSSLGLGGMYIEQTTPPLPLLSSWERKRGKREIPDRSIIRKEAEIWATHAEKSNVPLFCHMERPPPLVSLSPRDNY